MDKIRTSQLFFPSPDPKRRMDNAAPDVRFVLHNFSASSNTESLPHSGIAEVSTNKEYP